MISFDQKMSRSSASSSMDDQCLSTSWTG